MPCGKTVEIKKCPPDEKQNSSRESRALKSRQDIRKRPSAIVCNTTELVNATADFYDKDRYLIGKECEEGNSIQKY